MEAAADTRALLKMGELAQRAGVSPATVRHYLREGLLDDTDTVVRTSRNMAWYDPALVARIRLIKRLQEDRYMPLPVIKGMLDEDPARAQAMVDLEDRIIEHALATRERGRTSRAEASKRYDMPPNVLDRLQKIGILRPTARGYDADELRIIEAVARLRAGGYDDVLGLTIDDSVVYREALEPLAGTLVRRLMERLEGKVETERAIEILADGIDPLRELAGAILSKYVLDELQRVRERHRRPAGR
jgi:DNA-binding transcriptional MerR regulator